MTGGSVATLRPRPGGGARDANPPPPPPPLPPGPAGYSIASFGHTHAICPKCPQFYPNVGGWVGGAESGWGEAYARSIFAWSLVGGALGIRLGCGRCRHRSNIAWRRRWVVQESLRIRGLVCGSCSIAASVMHRYGGRRKLTNSSPSWKRHAVIQSSMVPLCNNPFFVPLSEATGTVRTRTRTLLNPAYYGYAC